MASIRTIRIKQAITVTMHSRIVQMAKIQPIIASRKIKDDLVRSFVFKNIDSKKNVA